jgi:hypothetical protein
MSTIDKPAPKIPYSSPVLQVYGSIRNLTQNIAATGMGDGAMAGSAKS